MLNETATAGLAQGIIQEIGEIERNEGARVVVSTPQGIVRAQVAFSCLTRPACGDTVLVAQRDGAVFVLAVLERRSAAPTELALTGDVSLSVDGKFALTADHLDLQGQHSAALRAPELTLTADKLSLVARGFYWLADTLESTARLVKQVADVWSVSARTHQRQVKEMEWVRVGSLDVRADDLINIGACHTLVKSRELTKIDGKQIQVG